MGRRHFRSATRFGDGIQFYRQSDGSSAIEWFVFRCDDAPCDTSNIIDDPAYCLRRLYGYWLNLGIAIQVGTVGIDRNQAT